MWLSPFPDSSHITSSTISTPPSLCSGCWLHLELALASHYHPLSCFHSSLFTVFPASLLSPHFLFTCSIWSWASHKKKKERKFHDFFLSFFSLNPFTPTPPMDTDNSVVNSGVGVCGRGIWGIGGGYRGTWGGEHTIQCTDDVLWNCVPETSIILIISTTQKFS